MFLHDGTAVIVSDTSAAFDLNTVWPIAGYIFDLATQGLTEWCAAMLPPLAGRALLATKTRPHVEINDDGLLATFRGVNFNEGASP